MAVIVLDIQPCLGVLTQTRGFGQAAEGVPGAGKTLGTDHLHEEIHGGQPLNAHMGHREREERGVRQL